MFGRAAQTPILITLRMIKLFTLSLSIIFAIACNSSKKTIANKSAQSTTVKDSTYRFNVSFISIGSGIDSKAKQQFNEFVEQFNNKNKVTITPEITTWGREGETDYCIKLEELSSEIQKIFINETKELLKNSKLIRYSENSMCKQRKK